MIPSTLKSALVIRDLLQQPEGSVVIIGRENLRRDDFNSLQIAIDSLSPATRVASGQSFDGDNELMTIGQRYRAPVTVNFYGDDAYTEAERFMLLLESQAGYDAQRLHSVTMYAVSSITDVKLLTGEQYSNRFELTLNVFYNVSADVPTLRIDEAQTNIVSD